MDDNSFNIRVPKRWVRVAMIVGVTALIVAPLTAIASHSFTDVPNTNTFHEDIAEIADAGVTLGCNPPDNDEYCPDDNVTRGQMAAFMNRLGALGPGKTPVVNAATAEEADNADTVDGKHADAFVEEGEANTISTGMVQDGAVNAAKLSDESGLSAEAGPNFFSLANTTNAQVVDSTTISVPAPGVLIARATGYVNVNHVNGTVDNVALHIFSGDESLTQSIFREGVSSFLIASALPTDPLYRYPFSAQRVFDVASAGDVDLNLVVRQFTGANIASTDVAHSLITVEFYPTTYGSIDLATTSSASDADGDGSAD